nr:HNH endonuclease [Coleofasciculus sp. FACHB-542]
MFTRFEKLPIRVSELKTCFYCGNSLPATAKEHIFNSSWGGSHKTGDLICNECNISFSTQTDPAFSVYIEAVMNAWSFKGERHKDVPKIILKGDYFLEKGGMLKLKQAIIEDEIQSDGTVNPHLVFNSRSQAKHWIEEGGMATWLGRLPSAEEQKYFKELIKQATPYALDARPQQFSSRLNLREQYRSSAHTILKCLKFYLPEWVSSDLTKPAQQFARYDQGDWRFFAVNVEQLFSIAEHAASKLGLGVHHNSVEVYWCSHLKMVIGVLTILHRVKRTVVIAQNYSGPDAILYVAEDTHGSKKPPQALFAEFDSKQFSLPLLGVQYFASLPKMEQFFYNELRVLVTLYYPIDAITARLIEGIKAVNEKPPRINETAIEEYVNLFLEFISNLSKILGVPIDPDRARTKLFEYGFSSLVNQYIGRTCTDLDITDLMVKALDHVMKDCNLNTP